MLNDFKAFVQSLIILLKRIWQAFASMLVKFFSFIGPVEDSLRGVISPEEFYRVLILAISGGTSFQGFVQYLHNHVNEFVSDSTVAAGLQAFITHCENKHLPVAVFTVVLVGDYIRRKYAHGNKL